MTNEQLREWRESMGFTQRKAAEELGISQSAYSAMELGRSHRKGSRPMIIDRRTALACYAISTRVRRAGGKRMTATEVNDNWDRWEGPRSETL